MLMAIIPNCWVIWFLRHPHTLANSLYPLIILHSGKHAYSLCSSEVRHHYVLLLYEPWQGWGSCPDREAACWLTSFLVQYPICIYIIWWSQNRRKPSISRPNIFLYILYLIISLQFRNEIGIVAQHTGEDCRLTMSHRVRSKELYTWGTVCLLITSWSRASHEFWDKYQQLGSCLIFPIIQSSFPHYLLCISCIGSITFQLSRFLRISKSSIIRDSYRSDIMKQLLRFCSIVGNKGFSMQAISKWSMLSASLKRRNDVEEACTHYLVVLSIRPFERTTESRMLAYHLHSVLLIPKGGRL